MVTIYIAILAVGILVIVFILLNENKSQKTSAVDLLNSLDVDENPETLKPSTKPSASFLNRLSMENDKPKTITSKATEPDRKTLDRSTSELESKLSDTDIPTENPKNEELKSPEETA